MTTSRTYRTTSADGTRIAGRVDGRGPALVLVPGGPADGQTGWAAMLPHLTDHFTCYGMNTRGRGPSEDHPDHSRERLVEDVVALIESIADDVHLFGHSAGGAHALEAAANTDAVSSLTLYEPTLTEFADDEVLARYARALARVRQAMADGRVTEAAQIFLQDVAMVNDEELALAAQADVGDEMGWLIRVVLREVESSGLPQLSELGLLERITVPVRLLYGARTHPFYVTVVRRLADRSTACSVHELAGLGHLGPEVDGALVAEQLLAVLDRSPID